MRGALAIVAAVKIGAPSIEVGTLLFRLPCRGMTPDLQRRAAMAETLAPVLGLSGPCPLCSSRAASVKSSRAVFLRGPPHWHRSSSLLRHGRSRRAGLAISAHLGGISGSEIVAAHLDLAQQMLGKLDGSLFMLGDAAATADGALESTGVKQASEGWLGGLTDTLEKILIFLKDGLAALHVPYAYGFAIILLTFLVKAATYPLTKSQVQSTIAMQNLQPKLKMIQTRYKGDNERVQMETARLYKQAGVNPLAGCLPTLATLPVWIGLYRALSNVANEGLLTEGFFWIPSLSGPTTIAARQGGSGTAWLLSFQDGVPPLGWSDTIAYLILPVLLVGSQYVSMQLMQPPQAADESQKNTQLILKFLPLMIGYFSLSVPSGLSLYWLTNNVLSTAQQVYLRRGQAPPASDEIIGAGQAKRSTPLASVSEISSSNFGKSSKEDRRGAKFKDLKMKEAQRKAAKKEAAVPKAQAGGDLSTESSDHGAAASDGDVEDGEDGVIDVTNANEEVEVYTNGTGGPKVGTAQKRGKRSKRTRAD